MARPDSDQAPQSGPRSVLRVLEMLELVATQSDGLTLTEITTKLELPKTSVFSLLKALEIGGYLTQRSGRYVIGLRAFNLGAALRQPGSLAQYARSTLEWLAAETEETILLAVMADDGIEITYLDVIESEAPLRFTVRVGNRRPLYCAAAGQAMLAFLPAKLQQRYVADTPFIKFTGDTLDKDALISLLPEIRKKAVALDANGIVDGAAAIASPIFDRNGSVTCAVAIAGPSLRMVGDKKRFAELSKEAGRRISTVLGYEGVYPAPWSG